VLVEPKGTYLYVANSGSNNISAYRINLTTGALAMLGAPAPTGKTPRALAADSNGVFLYSANRDSNNISGFRISRTTGTLIPLAPATFATGSQPHVVQIDPTNKLLFAGNIESRNVYTYAINVTTGVLSRTSIMQSRGQVYDLALLAGPYAVAYKPAFAYAALDYPMVAYSIDPSSGALNQLEPTNISASALAVDPLGKFLFTGSVRSGNASVYTYAINQTSGALSLPVAAAGLGSCGVHRSFAIEPSGRFVYVVGACGLSGFSINRTTRQLSELPGSPFDAQGAAYDAIAVDPTGRFLALAHRALVRLFKINAFTGALTYVSSSPSTLACCEKILAGANGRFLIGALGGGTNITGLVTAAISPSSGTLSWVSGSPFGADCCYPLAFTADPLGKYVFLSWGDGPGSRLFRMNDNGTLTMAFRFAYLQEDLFARANSSMLLMAITALTMPRAS
jgi:6-phosphogluconolactonase (cycloisomerase 2 family)